MTRALRQQQQDFAAAIWAEVAPGPGALLAATPDGKPARLAVYHHAYRARLAAALRDNYEILALALGDEAFDALARAYLASHPPTQPSIRWFGERLAEFMAAQAESESALLPHPAFVDLARMDAALRSAFDAADAPVLERSALQAVAPAQWPTLRFTAHPSVALVPLHWAVEAAWRALREHEGEGEPTLPAPEVQPHRLLVWRRGLETQWRSLDDTEAVLLQALLAGDDFTELCVHAAVAVGDEAQAATTVAGALDQWLSEGLLSQGGTD
jgi:hypothetical protein